MRGERQGTVAQSCVAYVVNQLIDSHVEPIVCDVERLRTLSEGRGYE
jgi:hypothetical protein